jgi:hypothetical protein
MRRGLAVVSAGLIAAGVLGPSLADAVTTDPPRRIHMARVVLNQDALETGGVAAWVPTGSENRKCLVTLLESNFATFGQTVYCGVRFVEGEPGVWIHIFFPLEFTPPPEFNFDVAVFQQGARSYGQPIPCPGVAPEDPCFD